MKYLSLLLLISLFITACSTTKKPADTSTLIESPVQVPPKTEQNAISPKKNLGNDSNRTVTCKVDNDERTITHVFGSNGTSLEDKRKCQVAYKKHNTDEVVAYAHHQAEFCAEVFDKIIKNLQDGNFICADDKPSSNKR